MFKVQGILGETVYQLVNEFQLEVSLLSIG